MNYKRISKYMPGIDGTLLAVDLYLPETGKKVPLLLKAGYDRRRHQFESEKAAIERFLNAEYAVAIVEVRGSCASFGVSDGFYGPMDGKDLKCIVDALTREPWCSGTAGTFGGSNYGMSQEILGIEQPAALRAIAPCDCSMDFYDQDFPNGVSALPRFLSEADPDAPPAPHQPEENDPVDNDPDRVLLSQAEHIHEKRNYPFLFQHISNMCRDDVHPRLGYRPNLEVPSWERMEDMRHGHVTPWNIGSWFDPGCTNKLLTYKSWGGRLILGPWAHCGMYRDTCDFPGGAIDWVEEHRKFYDHYLKNVDNGADRMPPVCYYTIGENGGTWKYENDFPVEGTTYPSLFLTPEGTLSETPSENAGENTGITRDDIMIYGPGMRMDRNVTKDLRPEDEKSVLYTSAPLPEDMELTGVPILNLYASSTRRDGNVIVVLEEITPDGFSHFLTEGVIRASHAKCAGNAVYASLGLPYHRGFREDMTAYPLTEEVARGEKEPLLLSFHLEALSRLIKKGSKLQLSIAFGGSGYEQPKELQTKELQSGALQPEARWPKALQPEALWPKALRSKDFRTEAEATPVVTLYTGGAHPSELILPVIRARVTAFSAAAAGLNAAASPDTVINSASVNASTDAADDRTVLLFKHDLYVLRGKLSAPASVEKYPVLQVYPEGPLSLNAPGKETALTHPGTVLIYETADFTATLKHENSCEILDIPALNFHAECPLPMRYTFGDTSGEIPLPERIRPADKKRDTLYLAYPSYKNLYVASVPVAHGVRGNMNPMMRKSFDIFIDLLLPDPETVPAALPRNTRCSDSSGTLCSASSEGRCADSPSGYPVIVNIHGFGGNHRMFEKSTAHFLEKGYAVASVDYRLTPPCTWDASVADAKACIRYLKAHAPELSLDPNRIGVLGGSMGGYLSSMLAATNGDPAYEWTVGGNTGFTSKICAAVSAFAPNDLLHFGDDCLTVWPGNSAKAMNGDGPYAPPASMIGYVGPGCGVADIKAHAQDQSPKYEELRKKLADASPVTHVSENSAPLCLVHGIFDCGIQVPFDQSVRMFRACTAKGVKSLLLCNNKGMYGEDPEVASAVEAFLMARV